MLNHIALRRLRCWTNISNHQDRLQAKILGLELGKLGFKINNIEDFGSTTREEFAAALDILKAMRGDNVKYVPLFAGFPDDLPNDDEYLFRRILGFLGLNRFGDSARFGANPITQMQSEDLWQAAVETQSRQLSDTHTEWIALTIISQQEAAEKLIQWASDLIYGATSIQDVLWGDIFAVLDQLNVPIAIENIQIKETLARLAANQWQKWGKVIVRTPTDLLRMFAFIQGQDVSLAKSIDLKGLKFSKPQRREIMAFLNRCPALAEDLQRYKRLWVSLSKWLHPGDYVKQFPIVVQTFDDLRNDRIKSFESFVINSPLPDRIGNLLERPSVLLRKLTWLLKDNSPEVVAEAILRLQDNVAVLPLPLLASAYFAVKYDGNRVVINKQGKAHTVGKRASLGDRSGVLAAIETLILSKLSNTKSWDKVWIDPALDKLVLPLQSRKQSDGLLNLARGSRIPFKQDIIRLFVYWQESDRRTDLDLSVMKLDTNFNFVGHVGWNQYGGGQDIAHSGDIQSAPLGAAEFIDLRFSALEEGYILPAVIRYAGEGFAELKACYAGWMNRLQVGGTQAFDAKTVAEKVDVNQGGKTWIPFILDVTTKEIIYVDIYAKGQNVVEGNAHFPALAAGLAAYWQAKPTFGALAHWYVRANNAMLVSKESATTTIGASDEFSINVLKLVGQGVTSF